MFALTAPSCPGQTSVDVSEVLLFPTKPLVFIMLKQRSWGHVVPTGSVHHKEEHTVEEMGNSSLLLLSFFCLETAGVLFPEQLQLVVRAIPCVLSPWTDFVHECRCRAPISLFFLLPHSYSPRGKEFGLRVCREQESRCRGRDVKQAERFVL